MIFIDFKTNLFDNIRMRKGRLLLIILTIWFITLSSAQAQRHSRYRSVERYDRNSVFILLGYSSGPSFEDFVDWANDYYGNLNGFNSSDSIKDFTGAVDFSAGLRVRFSRFIASEFDFTTYTLRTKQNFFGTSNDIITHDLELNVMIISASVMVLFDFVENQRFLPFIASGVSVFPIRLDHRIDFWDRHTKTALAVNFAVGLDTQISSKYWASLRADWTLGKTQMPVSPIYGQPYRFELDLSTSQLHAGVLYGFH